MRGVLCSKGINPPQCLSTSNKVTPYIYCAVHMVMFLSGTNEIAGLVLLSEGKIMMNNLKLI